MHRWLLTLALCALCSPVLAEEAPAPSATTTSPATAAPAPAATSPAAAVPAPQPSPAPAVKDEPKEKAEELHDFTLVRIDLEDGFELHPWVYHEFRLTEHWGILGTLHFQLPGLSDRQAPFAELDIGPNLHVGDFQINPQIGFDLVWAANAQGEKRTTAWDVMPQLYVLYSAGRFNAEFWNMFFIPFNGDPASYQGRLLASVRVVGGLAVGPHVELNWVHGKSGVDRFAGGGDLWYAFHWATVGLFLAYETERKAPEMRLTFLKEL
jgi:hypothetical protein